MEQIDLRQDPLPDEMRILLDAYPREAWDAHPNFRDATRNWLGAHKMFRRLTTAVRKDTEDYLDSTLDAGDFASRLAYRGNALVGNLHGHHGWEDMEYFPELSAADSRFDAGLEILENDHKVLDEVLEDFTESAIQTLGLIDSQDSAARGAAGKILASISVVEKLLARHLVDEEELAVPIIIHHKLRG